MFIAALFKVVKYPSMDNWVKKMWYIYTMDYYSAIRKDEILPFATTLMDLESIMLNEISQTGKDKNHVITLIKQSNKQSKRNVNTDNSMNVTRRERGRGE